MKTLKELLAEHAAVEQALVHAQKQDSEEALRKVRALVEQFGFTAQQVFPWKPPVVKVVAKYLDPKSGKTWSGRGKAPAWIAGQDRDAFLIEQAQPRQQGPYLAEMAARAAQSGGRR